jgi:hypothetical protein
VATAFFADGADPRRVLIRLVTGSKCDGFTQRLFRHRWSRTIPSGVGQNQCSQAHFWACTCLLETGRNA